jgi:hypothetical protein
VESEGRSLTLGLFACLECATGLGLLLVPGIVIGLLFGPRQPVAETLLLARLGGAALLAIGVVCWGARAFHRSRAGLGLLIGVTLYNGLAAAILAYAAFGLDMQGVLIWPAALYHAALLPWCLASARRMQRQRGPAR